MAFGRESSHATRVRRPRDAGALLDWSSTRMPSCVALLLLSVIASSQRGGFIASASSTTVPKSQAVCQSLVLVLKDESFQYDTLNSERVEAVSSGLRRMLSERVRPSRARRYSIEILSRTSVDPEFEGFLFFHFYAYDRRSGVAYRGEHTLSLLSPPAGTTLKDTLLQKTVPFFQQAAAVQLMTVAEFHLYVRRWKLSNSRPYDSGVKKFAALIRHNADKCAGWASIPALREVPDHLSPRMPDNPDDEPCPVDSEGCSGSGSGNSGAQPAPSAGLQPATTTRKTQQPGSASKLPVSRWSPSATTQTPTWPSGGAITQRPGVAAESGTQHLISNPYIIALTVCLSLASVITTFIATLMVYNWKRLDWDKRRREETTSRYMAFMRAEEKKLQV